MSLQHVLDISGLLFFSQQFTAIRTLQLAMMTFPSDFKILLKVRWGKGLAHGCSNKLMAAGTGRHFLGSTRPMLFL